MRRFIFVLFLLAGWQITAQVPRTNYFAVPDFLNSPSAFAASTNASATNKPWNGLIAVGLTLTRGNSRTLLANGSAHAVRSWGHGTNELILDGNVTYGETAGSETAETADANAQYNRAFTKRLFAGLKLDAFHDGIADIHYRFTAAPLVGYYAVKTTNTLLGIELGPGYINSAQDDVHESYAILRLGERYEYKISKTARVWQTIEVMPQVNRFDNYLVNFELGAEASLTKSFTLRAVLQDYYNNVPAAGRQRNDLRLVTGIGFKF